MRVMLFHLPSIKNIAGTSVCNASYSSSSTTMNNCNNPCQVHAKSINHYNLSDLNHKISDEQRFIVSVPLQQFIYILCSFADLSPIMTTNTLPDVAWKMKKEKSARVQLVRNYNDSEESIADLFTKVQESAASVTSKATSNTLANRDKCLGEWLELVMPTAHPWPGSGTWANGNGSRQPWAALGCLSQLKMPKVVGAPSQLFLCFTYTF